ncbi:hypothetical protein [Glaciimonas sp. PCH181]|nr:hypothetical protein [Glaciimonas sp. PCH181]
MTFGSAPASASGNMARKSYSAPCNNQYVTATVNGTDPIQT